ncbi:hypothetical protein MTR_7g077360 [Medicago truncatula]|uniref:Uncharacterized protein n=1 Tax=Medicago truncatula TaxID=3880 RepID=G7L4L9_MEDTR|nr:hypothetical protein MTR_7g077360 [Medicago truncatula]
MEEGRRWNQRDCRGVRGAIWFGFKAKTHSNCKIKNLQFGFVRSIFEIQSEPNQTKPMQVELDRLVERERERERERDESHKGEQGVVESDESTIIDNVRNSWVCERIAEMVVQKRIREMAVNGWKERKGEKGKLSINET